MLGWGVSKKNILCLYEGGILPNNPTRLLPIGDPPPGAFASPQSLATLLTSNPTMLFIGVQQLHTTSVSVSYAACWYG